MIGRQPILDRNQNVIGYELLFRSSQGSPGTVDGDFATTEVILNTFSEIGIDNLVGGKMAFINFTRNFISGELPIPFPPGQTVIEVLEDIKLDKSILSDLATLAQKGFTIAMDDVVTFERVKPSIGLAKIVKIDFPFVRKDDLPWLVRKIRESGMWPLAEKVETQEEYQFCRSVGFELFQGYYFSKPSIIHGSRIDSSRMIILHALALLQDPNINFQMLEDVLQRDVTLSYKLLKLSNSAYYSQQGKVNSISQTIGMIGITQLSGWLTLMLISSTENKPHELTTVALLRAKLCESLGKLIGYPDTNSLFMIGLFSVLDALFDTPIDKVLSALPIAADVANALLTRSGQAGQIYTLVLLLESGQLEYASALGLPVDVIRKAYVQSVRWTNDVIAKTEAALKSN
jgi:c-di-GMP phosphodiesterase